MEDVRHSFTPTRSKKTWWIAAVILLLLVVGAGYQIMHRKAATSTTGGTSDTPHVSVTAVNDLHATSTFETVGSVTAMSEAHIQAEASGRITSVPVQLGQTVSAGTVVATLENSAQQAALLSAQGSYEAAQANAHINDLSSSDAQTGLAAAVNAANTAYKNAYTSVSTIVYSSIDGFYADPNAVTPSVRFPTNQASYFNSERVALQTILPDWQQHTTNMIPSGQIDTSISAALTTSQRVASLLDSFITETKNARTTTMLDGKTLNSYTPGLLAARTTLNATIASLQGAETSLQTAESAVSKAQIAATSSNVSLASAQLTQAEGALRAAQNNYDKTVIRTPITGTINALYVKTGQYANPNMPIAIVANNNGLEVDTYVTESDSVHIALGDTVKIGDTATGTIIAKAAALDPTTGKVAVRISLSNPDGIVNGSTVHVTFTEHAPETPGAKTYTVPLTALKLGVQKTEVFTVSSSSTLVAHTVTVGPVVGDSVSVTSGLTPDMQIVTDARGLKADEAVILDK